jgi:hypothetical protein
MQISKVGHPETSVRTKTSKNTKTYPKSALRKTARKIEGVKDPTSSPPFKPGVLRILTRKGEVQKRDKIRGTLKNLSDREIRAKLKKAKMPVSDKAPRELILGILEGGTEAGMIS